MFRGICKNRTLMCLAIPGKIIAIDDSTPVRRATVDFGGVYKSICIQYVDASTGDFILAHAGMAIARLDREEAEATLADFDRLSHYLTPDDHVV